VQVKVYVVVAAKTTASLPELAALSPDQLPPLAVQLFALDTVQVNCTIEPVTALATFEVNVTTGSEKTNETP
jgi:hypothetical protein